MARVSMLLSLIAVSTALTAMASAEATSQLQRDLADRIASMEKELAEHRSFFAARELGDQAGKANGQRSRRVGHRNGYRQQPGRRTAAGDDPWAGAPSATDTIWLLLCGALVMFMQCGFAMLEAGCCRAKNVQNILMKNMADVCGGTIGWWVCGWALAYGGPYKDGYTESKFIGTKQFFCSGFLTTDAQGNQIPDPDGGALMLSWFFQWAFCSAAATIVSGGVAERVVFPGYLAFSVVMTAFIYPLVVCWTWGFGWLAGSPDDGYINEVGFMDFAGSGIVHMCGGVGALIGAIAAGPRDGRFLTDGSLDETGEFDAHNVPLVVLGTFILWFGWYGFNCGSTLAMSDAATGALAAQVAMNTTIAAASGGITTFGMQYALLKKYDLVGFCSGILAGLVSITAGCGNVESGSAFLIGVIGGCVYLLASKGLKKLKIDDPLDAFPIHGCCGAWGVLAAALFDWGNGFDFAHGWNGFSCITGEDGNCKHGAFGQQLVANIVEIVVIAVWTAAISSLVFFPMRKIGALRASDDLQQKGMDVVKHSPSRAYTMST